MSAATAQQPTSRLTPLRIVPAPRTRPPVLAETESWVPDDLGSPRYVQDALVDRPRSMTDEQLFGERPTRRDDLPDPSGWGRATSPRASWR